MRIHQFAAYLLPGLVFSVFSCIKTPPGFDPRDGNNVYSGCKILKTVSKQNAAEDQVFTRTFYYNSKGDPEKVIVDHQLTGTQNIGFKYDKYGRLQEYSAYYDNGGFDFIHRYKYDNNRIVIDSQYSAINSFFPPLVTLYYVKYDKLNRVIQDSVTIHDKTIFVSNYVYDAKGNLSNGNDYDDKMNLHRTNKVWMFIDRNYSVNNPVGASSYQAGLPLGYPPTQRDIFFLTASAYGNGGVTIFYDCK
jgi:hypothetical protein